jgi:hypothetical protein
MSHTPGPWHRNIRASGKYPTVFAGRNTHVAVATQMPNPEETECNISLIAAAPDLLAALQSFVALCPSAEGLGGHASIGAFLNLAHRARAAINKAKGE